MATARQIIALLNSLNEGDEEQFFSIALQVAAAESKRGRRAVADELRGLVEQSRDRRRLAVNPQRPSTDVVVPITRPRGELQTLLVSSQPKVKLQDVVLKNDSVERLRSVLSQQREREKLQHFGLSQLVGFCLSGPPVQVRLSLLRRSLERATTYLTDQKLLV